MVDNSSISIGHAKVPYQNHVLRHTDAGRDPDLSKYMETPVSTQFDQYRPSHSQGRIRALRFVLNFKRLAYTTRWTPTSLATQTCIENGIPASGTKSDGGPHYTLPALIDYTPQLHEASAEPVRLSDSTRIIEYLEKAYPEASFPAPGAGDDYPHSRELFPARSRALHALVEHHVQNVLKPPLYDLFTLALYDTKLPIDQVDYAIRKPKSRGLEQLEDLQVHGEAEREKVWAKLRAAFKVLAQAAEAGEKFYESEKRDKVERFANGIPVFQPLGVTYADFAVTAVLMMIRNISRDEAWKRVKVWDGGRWERLLTEMERRWGMIDEKMIT